MKKNLYLVFSLFLIFLQIDIKIHAQCDPPLAVGDFAVTLQGNAVVIPVQKNDTTTIFGQPVIRPLLTQILTVPSPSVATISVLNNDSILFIPQGSFTGTATFTYRVCNQCGCSNSATVVVLVSSYCGPPLLKRDEFFVYNNFNNKLNVLENDSFPIKIPYTITFSQPSSGNISLSGNQLIYFNSGNNTGVDSFSYTVCYNRSSNDTCPSCDTATVVLNIVGNCVSPVAADDQLQTLQGKRDTISVLQNDDLNNFVLTGFSIIKLPANGSSSIFNNRIIYQSNASFVGLDTILYNVCTTCGCDTGQLIVSVAPVACQKPKAVLDVAPTGYSSSCPFTYQVIQNDINGLNCLPLKLTKIIQQPFKGTAVADTAAGNIIYSGPGLFLDTFVYIKYEVCNNVGCDTGTLALYIAPYECNAYAPTLFNDIGSVCNRDTLIINVLKNDFDKDFGQKVKLKNIAGFGNYGDAFVINDSIIMFVPFDTTYEGPNFFFYTACDNGNPTICDIARVDLTIFGCYQPPVINDQGTPVDTIRITIPEDSSAVLCFNVSDPDNDPTRVTSIYGNLVNVSTSDTIFSTDTVICINIVPPPDWNGSDTFNVVVCDNTKLCDTVTVIVRVLPVSDGIIAVEDNVTYRHGITMVINQTANDIDEDGTGFSTTSVFDDGSPNGVFTLLSNGNIQYTPNSNFAGIDSFYYVICQPPNVTPRICDTGLIVVLVPVKANNDEAMTDNEKPVSVETRPNDAAVPGAYVSICGNPKNGRVEIIDTPAGTIRYIPNVGFSGADSFCYRLCGVINANVFCSDATVKINVSPPPPLEIPEGFSPNNDGINDKFVIKNIERFPKSELLVFNRWGDIVWRSPGEGYKNDFDGTWEQNNQPLPDATYYYVLKLNDGKSKDIAGFLVIHR